jgi:hypothetical protein
VLAEFDPSWQQGRFFVPTGRADQQANRESLEPLGFAFMQVWLAGLLSGGRGLLLHASGVVDQSQGYLFLGASEAGKSTLAGLWHPQAQVLSDERVVLREQDGELWIYGTPWHSQLDVFSAAGARLEKVFLIRHAPPEGQHQASRLTPQQAAVQLVQNAVLPRWDAAGMQYSLDLAGKLAEAVPCWDLAFTPDESVLEYIRCVS